MSEENVTPVAEATPVVVQEAPVVPEVQSPPKPRVAVAVERDPRAELTRLANEVAKHGTRKLLWEYLKLRGKVIGRQMRVAGPQKKKQESTDKK